MNRDYWVSYTSPRLPTTSHRRKHHHHPCHPLTTLLSMPSPLWPCLSCNYCNQVHHLYQQQQQLITTTHSAGKADTKQSDGEVPVMPELWGTQSTPSLLTLSGPLGHGGKAPDRALSMGQIELNCVLMLNWIVWIRTRNVLTIKLYTYI